MKHLFLLLIVLLWFGCESKKSQEKEITEGYALVERLDAVAFEYSPGTIAVKTDAETFSEAGFAGELLRLLDPSLTTAGCRVIRSTETISSAQGDTLSIDVYDFCSGAGREILARHFVDSAYIDKFIGVLKPPYRGLFFLNDSNLCVVVSPGLMPKENLKNLNFKKYIVSGKESRMKAAGAAADL